jgi:hypothetical protein
VVSLYLFEIRNVVEIIPSHLFGVIGTVGLFVILNGHVLTVWLIHLSVPPPRDTSSVNLPLRAEQPWK